MRRGSYNKFSETLRHRMYVCIIWNHHTHPSFMAASYTHLSLLFTFSLCVFVPWQLTRVLPIHYHQARQPIILDLNSGCQKLGRHNVERMSGKDCEWIYRVWRQPLFSGRWCVCVCLRIGVLHQFLLFWEMCDVPPDRVRISSRLL